MFHTYVLTSEGHVVDFDRARLLMDRGLLRDAIKAMNEAMAAAPPQTIPLRDKDGVVIAYVTDPHYGPQWIWEDYCARHGEKYGTRFVPDADPKWDR